MRRTDDLVHGRLERDGVEQLLEVTPDFPAQDRLGDGRRARSFSARDEAFALSIIPGLGLLARVAFFGSTPKGPHQGWAEPVRSVEACHCTDQNTCPRRPTIAPGASRGPARGRVFATSVGQEPHRSWRTGWTGEPLPYAALLAAISQVSGALLPFEPVSSWVKYSYLNLEKFKEMFSVSRSSLPIRPSSRW